MKLIWKIEERDAQRIRDFVRSRRRDPLVRQRISRNVRRERDPVNVSRFWHALLLGLLTTQQRSGPDSPVTRFLGRRPFPLNFRRCSRARSPSSLAQRTLHSHGGIRRVATIADQVSRNLPLLRGNRWIATRAQLRRLEHRHVAKTEREVAGFLAKSFLGLGPKQSRNVLQFMGLTRHEIPLDSRVIRWFNRYGFPLKLSAQALSDPNYYAFVSDGIQALCKTSGVLPCVLDAAIFSSFD